jgi:hypothetical protein
MLPMLRAGGWLANNYVRRLWEVLERINYSTPDLFHTIWQGPHHEQGGGCCNYRPSLMQPLMHRATSKQEYLKVGVGRKDGRQVHDYAHRILCCLTHGLPPRKGMVVRHMCSNQEGRCINPWHLEWSTTQQNNDDVRALKMARAAHRRRQHMTASNQPQTNPDSSV